MRVVEEPVVDYKFFGSHINGIYFSDRNVHGNDKFLSSLARSYSNYSAPEWIKNAINLYLVSGEITEELKVHFSAPLKIIRILRLKAQQFPDEDWQSKLEDFEFGFKLSLTHIIDEFRLFFEEADPIYKEWWNKRKSYSQSDYHRIDDPYHDKLVTTVDKQFALTIVDYHTFLEFGSKLFADDSSCKFYLVGDGFFISQYYGPPGDGYLSGLFHISEDVVLESLDFVREGGDICLAFSDSNCSLLHNHQESIFVIQLSIPRETYSSAV